MVKSSPAELVEMSLHRKRGPMILDDLRRLPESPLVVAEGSTVSPSGVADRSRAVWLLPSPEFQQARLADRGRDSRTAGSTRDQPSCTASCPPRSTVKRERRACRS